MTRQSARTQSRTASAPNHALAFERRSSLGPHLSVQCDATAETASPAAAMVRDVVESPGQPLDRPTRREMESRFGYDLSAVRLHTGVEAAASARALDANAYTAGPNIVFGDGRYEPGSRSGWRLLTHELTHAIQQNSGPVAGIPVGPDITISTPNDRFEQEASATEEDIASEACPEHPEPASSLDQREEQPGTLAIQRDAATTWGAIGAIAGGASLALALLAYLRPPEALNPAPVTGGLNLNPNPFSFNSMQTPVQEPPSNRPRYQQALRGRPQEHKILDLSTDDDNHVAVNLALKTDGYNILDASVRTGDMHGYLGGSRGSSAALNFSATQLAAAGPGSFFNAPEPAAQTSPTTGQAGAANTSTQAQASAQPQQGTPGTTPQTTTTGTTPQTTPAAQQPGAAPTASAATPEPAEAILTFTGTNAKNQGNPQNFAGQITVRADGFVRCDDCATTNGVGRAETLGEFGVVDYRTQSRGGGIDLGLPFRSTTPSPDGGRFDPTQLLPFGRPMT
jgi:Domain of unknown function (DUF4157)